jgi:hypothetical protein
MENATMNMPAAVPPLKSLTKAGKPYERSAKVLMQIAMCLAAAQSELIPNLEGLENETVVFFARHFRRIDEGALAALLRDISRRVAVIAQRWLWGVGDEDSGAIIVGEVDLDILKLVLSDKPSRQSDFLEISFVQAVERRTINAVEKYKNSAIGRQEDARIADRREGDGMPRTIELIPDPGPGPAERLLRFEDHNHRHQLLRMAIAKVTDRRQLEAVILHYGYGWPIVSKEKADLVGHFGLTEGQVKYLLAEGMKAMREALGVQL